MNEWTRTIEQCTQSYIHWNHLPIAPFVHRIQGIMGRPGHRRVGLNASYCAGL